MGSVTWQPNSAITVNGDNSLTKTDGTNTQTGSCISLEQLWSEVGGWMRFTSIAGMCSSSSNGNSLGLNDGRSVLGLTNDIDFNFHFHVTDIYFMSEFPPGFSSTGSFFAVGKEFKITVGEVNPREVRYYYDGVLRRTSPNLAAATTLYNVNVEMTPNATSLPDVEFYANVWITQDLDSLYVGTDQVVTLTGHGGSAVDDYEWSADGGDLSDLSGVAVITWSPPAEPGIYTVTLTDGTSSYEIVISVAEAPVFVPSLPIEVETRKQVLAMETETGVRQTITKSKAFRFYALNFAGRKRGEYEGIEPFWESVYPDLTFGWTNAVCDASGDFYVDSPLKWRPARHNLIDYSLAIKRKLPVAVVEPDSNVMPFTPSYGYEGTPTKEALVSDGIDYSRMAAALSDKRCLFSLGFRARLLAEALEMEQFWNYHYPRRQIVFTEPVLNIEFQMWIDSNFKWTVRPDRLLDYSFAVRGV